MLDLSSIQFAAIEGLAFSMSRDLAIASKEHVWIAVESGHVARLAIGKPDDDVTCVAFDHTRRLAIATKQSGLRIVDLDGKPSVTTIATTCCWHMMLWSPDGKYITGGQYEPWVSVIDVEKRAELRLLDPDEFDDSGRTALVFVDNGATLVSTAYNKLCRWRFADVIANKPKCRMAKRGVEGHAHLLDVVALADGSLLALADVERSEAYLQRFAPTGERIGKQRPVATSTLRLGGLGDAIALFDHDGGRVCSPELEVLRTLERADELDHVTSIAVSHDHAQIAAGGEHALGLWDVATGRALSLIRR